jgi:Uma2 family endonuclease
MIWAAAEGLTLIPNVSSLGEFLEWASSPEYPRHGQFSFLGDKLYATYDMELLFHHNLIKLEISAILHHMVRNEGWGYFFADRAFLKNSAATLATEPDGMFVSFDAIEQERVLLLKGREDDDLIVDGSPEMTLEVVSDASINKDTSELVDLYFEAGVAEYWLVDARREPLKFDIFKRGAKGFVATRKVGGWIKSAVFQRNFRLQASKDRLGKPEFKLDVKG